MREKLTKRQKQIFEEIKGFIRRQGYPPTIREIGEKFDLDPASTFDHLKALERKGYIRRTSTKARSLEVLEFIGGKPSLPDGLEVPLLGRVPAGEPLLATENIEDTIVIDKEWSVRGQLFFLKVVGDSMVGAQIKEGDLVLVRAQPVAERGEIVVALIEDEAVVKLFYPMKRYIELRSANPEYKPIRVDKDFRIVGKIIGLLRKY